MSLQIDSLVDACADPDASITIAHCGKGVPHAHTSSKACVLYICFIQTWDYVSQKKKRVKFDQPFLPEKVTRSVYYFKAQSQKRFIEALDFLNTISSSIATFIS